VTDKGLKNLLQLKHLELLDLSGTRATYAEIERLQKALPACRISR
jgi:hypothetical protein